jgi:Flp pilus assembly pilin Flp
MHRALGYAHATAHHHLAAARQRFVADERGQGTVEYVGLILLIAGIMAAVVAMKSSGPDLGKTIVSKLKDSIDGVGDPPRSGGRG